MKGIIMVDRKQELLEEIATDARGFFIDRGLSQVVDTLSELMTFRMAKAETEKKYGEAMDAAFVVKEITAFLVRISERVWNIDKLENN